MPRKVKNKSIWITTSHEYTRQIHSTERAETRFANMKNHNEKKAKDDGTVCCHDCRHFLNGCNEFIGMYHNTCADFVWW